VSVGSRILAGTWRFTLALFLHRLAVRAMAAILRTRGLLIDVRFAMQ